MGTDGNEIAVQFARQNYFYPLIGPESALGVSAKVGRGVVRGWTSRKHEEYWQSIGGQRLLNGFLKRLCAKNA
jgi:hypothetical protein